MNFFQGDWNPWAANNIFRAPEGYSISGYSWSLYRRDRFWGKVFVPLIDGVADFVYEEADHCLRACEREEAALLAAGKSIAGG